ncbi:MAG: polysaccharide biosynthesis C-terminal domain-containing protein, partial [Bacilli bacterium]|nr:polysaccharide biosynthesis C-terminal domain-containing protein [Bacilli bacterium]
RSVYIVAKEQQKYIWIISILGALFSLMCNYILIKLFGASGAAVGAILVQIFVNVILGFIIKPIRRNNVLMFKALNPMVIKEMLSEFFH